MGCHNHQLSLKRNSNLWDNPFPPSTKSTPFTFTNRPTHSPPNNNAQLGSLLSQNFHNLKQNFFNYQTSYNFAYSKSNQLFSTRHKAVHPRCKYSHYLIPTHSNFKLVSFVNSLHTSNSLHLFFFKFQVVYSLRSSTNSLQNERRLLYPSIYTYQSLDSNSNQFKFIIFYSIHKY